MTTIVATGLPITAAQNVNSGAVGQFLLTNSCGLPIPAGTYVSGTLQLSYNTSASLIPNLGGVSVAPSITIGTGPQEVLATAQALGSYNLNYVLQAADLVAINAGAGTTVAGELLTNYDVSATSWGTSG